MVALNRCTFFFVVAATFLPLTSCTKQVRPLSSNIMQEASIKELLVLYEDRLTVGRGFKAVMEVKTRRPHQGGYTLLASWRSQEEAVRIQGFNLFGGTLFDLHLDSLGSDPFFSLNLPSEKRTIEAPLEAFDDMIGGKIPFGSTDLLGWVKRGGVPLISPSMSPEIEKRDTSYILSLYTHTHGKKMLMEKIWIERTAFWVKRVELFDESGARRGHIRMDDYRDVGPRSFPFRYEAETGGRTISLRFKELAITVPSPIGLE